MKIGIVGAGSVGATVAYSVALAGIADEIVLVDKTPEKAVGEAMDLAHCAAYIPPLQVNAGDLPICRGMDAVVVTAGVKRRPGEARTDLLRRNIVVANEIARPLAEANPDAVFVVVSNPVDLLTFAFIQRTGLPAARVVGSGTLLDSSRLRYLLARRFAVDARNVHAYVIGEHGPGATPVWSQAQVGAVPLTDFAAQVGVRFDDAARAEIFKEVLGAGQEVIQRKGATFYGVAQSVVRILTAIARNEGSVLTITVDAHGQLGIDRMALSLPVILDRRGVRRTVTPALAAAEAQSLLAAARALRAAADEVGL